MRLEIGKQSNQFQMYKIISRPTFFFLVWKAASLRYTSQYKEKTIAILFHADLN